METSQGSQALAWGGWIREAQWPVTPRGKALALACLGATVVPPPAHGLAQRVPKWLDFLPPPSTTTLPHHGPQGPREATGRVGSQSRRTPKACSSYTLEPDLPQGSRREDPPIPLGLFGAGRPHPHSFCCMLRPQLWAAITGLWVWAVVFAAGPGRSSRGKASRVPNI